MSPKRENPERRTKLHALGIFLFVSVVCLLITPSERLTTHTPYNHFALLADGWWHGRLDLGGPPPEYTGMNDFAVKDEKAYVSFPPFPAVLLAPFVLLSRDVEHVRDGLFFIALSGAPSAITFLALEKLRRLGRSGRTSKENLLLSLLLAFGTVYFFSAVQGTVWFAAHVVGATCAAGYLYASLEAERPFLAGLCLILGFATRTPLLFATPLFLFELWNTTRGDGALGAPLHDGARRRVLVERLLRFALPIALGGALLMAHNRARFGDAFEFGHRYLAIAWQPRIEKWGLFSTHYLGRNLGIVFGGLPFFGAKGVAFQINAHGLALWLTSPFFAWAIWPRLSDDRRTRATFSALAVTALLTIAPSLLYQNSGWVQFGYRFSNDIVVFVIALVALSGRRLTPVFWSLAIVAVVVNAFGAASFDRDAYAKYYFIDGTQKILFEPD